MSRAKDTATDPSSDAKDAADGGKKASARDAKPATGPAPVTSTAGPGSKAPPRAEGSGKGGGNLEGGDDDDKKAAEAHAAAVAATEMAAKAEREAQAAIARAAAAKEAARVAAEAEYKAIAAHVKPGAPAKLAYTFKRESEEIFRRDMGEPEFYLDKNDRFQRPILTPQQQESLTRQAEIPRDQTPAYVPEHVLSPEFEGVSGYERGVESYLEELRAALKRLKRSPDATPGEVSRIKSHISYLESIYENYYIGMNVFRTAKGGRSKLAR